MPRTRLERSEFGALLTAGRRLLPASKRWQSFRSSRPRGQLWPYLGRRAPQGHLSTLGAAVPLAESGRTTEACCEVDRGALSPRPVPALPSVALAMLLDTQVASRCPLPPTHGLSPFLSLSLYQVTLQADLLAC